VRARAAAGVPTPLRAAALGHLIEELAASDAATEDARQLDDLFRAALLSPSAVLRRAAAVGVARVPERFRDEIALLLARDPDLRLRRLLAAAP
jgi:hypothetical protein